MEEKQINTENIEEAKQVNTPAVVEENKLIPAPEISAEVQKYLDENQYYLLVPAHQLKSLLAQLEEAKQERKILYDIALSIMVLLGYADAKTRKPIPEIISGEESWMPGMLKSLADVMGLLTKTKFAITDNQKKKYEAELAEKFAFVKNLMPLMQKYGNENQQ